jgi:hypothetical protein
MSKTAIWVTCLLLVCGLVSTAAAFDPNTDPNLIARWMCEEGQGSIVSDSSPNGHDGTFVEGNPAWTIGFWGNGSAISLVYPTLVEVPAMNLKLTQATMAGWVLPNGTQSDWASFIMHRASSAHGFNLLGSRQLAYHWNDDAASWGYRGTAYYAADEWTHCAVTVEPAKATFYINGVSICSNSIPHAVSTWDGPVWLGGDRTYTDGTRHLNGALDDVMFFSRALTPAEIKSMVPARLKAYKPNPADGALSVTLPLLQWSKGDTAVFHDIYLGTSPDLTDADKKPRAYAPMYYHVEGLTPGLVYYWRIDEVEANGTVHQGEVWHFQAQPLTAYLPLPADGGGNVMLTPTLSWTAGQMATAHHVYFGASRQDVEEGAAGTDKGSLGATELSYRITETLKPDVRYYWRVDETSNNTVQTGPVWSFDTVLAGPTGAIRQWWSNIGGGVTIPDLTNNADFPDNPTGSEFVTLMEGPTGWGDNYGTRIYGWVYPPQSGDYTFWIASDDAGELWLSTDEDRANAQLIASVASWTNSREWTKEATQRSQPVKLEAGQRYYIEALQKEGGGGDNVAVAWQGPGFNMEVLGAGGVGPTPYLPQRAYSPAPADGAVDTVQSVVLTWSAGEKALKHEIYFGDDANAVTAADTSSSLFKGSQTGTSYDAGDLEWGKTYFWRVDEINAGEAESPWVGRVWSFTTANFIPVDDFESYDDAEGTGTRIYETWIDGYTDGLSGSTVGNMDPPFAEQTIVHGGLQSMPMDYDNTSSPFYSQAYREFSPVMNWTGNGVTDLSLWVRGRSAPIAPVTENGGKMTVSGEGADIWGTADQFTFVYKTLSGDGSLIARVTGNGTGSNRWAKGGVMIRDSLEAGSASAQMVMTGGDGNGAAFQNRAMTDLDMNANDSSSNSTAVTAIAPPYWVKIERTGSTITASHSADGQNWTVQGAPQFIPMDAPAYIGICVTSHAAGVYRTFEFDNLKATGASGAWETKEIGLARNSPQPLYVIVEDSTGKQATVVDPNAAAVNATTWTEWKIPLADLAGVNLSKVKALYIGVGDKAHPAADGTGRVYIDDIRVARPAPAEP